ncbi:MAG TPA: cyclic nucleotide-binding domain-containing protein [Anaerolineae bacterium]|nr:cyclic nucleotide-binding domain-containing protein [Anaerolineae bacterium]
MITPAINGDQKIKEYELFLMGQPIFNPYQPNKGPYVVVEGEVAVYRGTEWVETIRPGEFLDELTLAPAQDAAAIAKTNCQLVSIDEAMVAALEQYPPDFVVQIMRVMVERLTRRVVPPIRLVTLPQIQPASHRLPKTRASTKTLSLA